jgi:cytochrome c553
MHRAGYLLFALAVLALAGGCGARGDAARGERLFSGQEHFANSDALACGTCHVVSGSQSAGLGPSLAGIASTAATRVAGQSAEQYLRTSLVATDAYLTEGYQEGIMPRTYAKTLSDQELSDLVAYMLTLK